MKLFEPQGWFFWGTPKIIHEQHPEREMQGNKSPKKTLELPKALCRPRFTHKGAGGDFNDFVEFLKRFLEDPFPMP